MKKILIPIFGFFLLSIISCRKENPLLIPDESMDGIWLYINE